MKADTSDYSDLSALMLYNPPTSHYMEASAIRVDINELAKLERAVPPTAIITATIKFQLNGNLAFLDDAAMSERAKEQKVGKLLLEALKQVRM